MAELSMNISIAFTDDGGYILNAYSFNEAPIPVARLTDNLRGTPQVVDQSLTPLDEGYIAGRVQQQTRVAEDYAGLLTDLQIVVGAVFNP